jgi:hypothetical protein
MTYGVLAGAFFAAALALPVLAHARESAGASNWANGGGAIRRAT